MAPLLSNWIECALLKSMKRRKSGGMVSIPSFLPKFKLSKSQTTSSAGSATPPPPTLIGIEKGGEEVTESFEDSIHLEDLENETRTLTGATPGEGQSPLSLFSSYDDENDDKADETSFANVTKTRSRLLRRLSDRRIQPEQAASTTTEKSGVLRKMPQKAGSFRGLCSRVSGTIHRTTVTGNPTDEEEVALVSVETQDYYSQHDVAMLSRSEVV